MNANGNRLDAWLIYRCPICGRRWNRAVFHRRPVAEFGKDILERLQTNDQDLAERISRSRDFVAGLRTHTATEHFTVDLNVDGKLGHLAKHATLLIRNPSKCEARLDRLLANGLKLSRKEVASLFECGAMRLIGLSKKQLRRAPPDIVKIELQEPCPTNGVAIVERVLRSWKQDDRQ